MIGECVTRSGDTFGSNSRTNEEREEMRSRKLQSKKGFLDTRAMHGFFS